MPNHARASLLPELGFQYYTFCLSASYTEIQYLKGTSSILSSHRTEPSGASRGEDGLRVTIGSRPGWNESMGSEAEVKESPVGCNCCSSPFAAETFPRLNGTQTQRGRDKQSSAAGRGQSLRLLSCFFFSHGRFSPRSGRPLCEERGVRGVREARPSRIAAVAEVKEQYRLDSTD